MRKLQAMTGLPKIETIEQFEDILESMEERFDGKMIPNQQLVNLLLHGEKPSNYEYVLSGLDAPRLIANEFGLKLEQAERIVKGQRYDLFIMLKGVAAMYMGHTPPEEFKALCIDPTLIIFERESVFWKDTRKRQAELKELLFKLQRSLDGVIGYMNSTDEHGISMTAEWGVAGKVKILNRAIDSLK